MRIEGNIVDVINKRIYSGYIVVKNGLISEIVEQENLASQYIMPGFVDAHVHVVDMVGKLEKHRLYQVAIHGD